MPSKLGLHRFADFTSFHWKCRGSKGLDHCILRKCSQISAVVFAGPLGVLLCQFGKVFARPCKLQYVHRFFLDRFIGFVIRIRLDLKKNMAGFNGFGRYKLILILVIIGGNFFLLYLHLVGVTIGIEVKIPDFNLGFGFIEFLIVVKIFFNLFLGGFNVFVFIGFKQHDVHIYGCFLPFKPLQGFCFRDLNRSGDEGS